MSKRIFTIALVTLAAVSGCTRHHRVLAPHAETRVEVDRGRGMLQGAGLGLLVGGVGFAAYAAAENDDSLCASSSSECSDETHAKIAGTYGALIGAVAGGAIGAIIGSRDVYEARPSVVVTGERATAGLGWSF